MGDDLANALLLKKTDIEMVGANAPVLTKSSGTFTVQCGEQCSTVADSLVRTRMLAN